MIFCFKGDGDIRDQHCLHNWCADYELAEESVPEFEVMKFKGGGRRGGHADHSPAYI